MKLTLHSFKPGVLRDTVCEPGVEYLVFEYDVEPQEASTFFDKLVQPRDSFYLEGQASYFLDFWKEDDRSIWVEITGTEFWAYSEVSFDEANEIIGMLHRGEGFNDHIPTTNREWDAYAFLGKVEDR